MRLLDRNNVEWRDRAHFLEVAAKMMRPILVNHAIVRQSQKRGSSAVMVSLMEADRVPARTHHLIAWMKRSSRSQSSMSARAGLVELRYFGGLTSEEAAEVLGSSPRTANRESDLSRAWLFRVLSS